MRQHPSAYVSIRQHTSAYASIRQHASADVSIRQHTSAYVSIRSVRRVVDEHKHAPKALAQAIRERFHACGKRHIHLLGKHALVAREPSHACSSVSASADVRIRQPPSASVSLRQPPSASVSIPAAATAALRMSLHARTTVAPRHASANAVCLPMPRLEPVTTHTLPYIRFSFVI